MKKFIITGAALEALAAPARQPRHVLAHRFGQRPQGCNGHDQPGVGVNNVQSLPVESSLTP
jgi:hypothetical protein